MLLITQPPRYLSYSLLLLQAQGLPSDEAWLEGQDLYVQALLSWHDVEVQRHAEFQTGWVLARSTHSPDDYLHHCCDEGIPVPLIMQADDTFPITFPSRAACECPCP